MPPCPLTLSAANCFWLSARSARSVPFARVRRFPFIFGAIAACGNFAIVLNFAMRLLMFESADSNPGGEPLSNSLSQTGISAYRPLIAAQPQQQQGSNAVTPGPLIYALLPAKTQLPSDAPASDSSSYGHISTVVAASGTVAHGQSVLSHWNSSSPAMHSSASGYGIMAQDGAATVAGGSMSTVLPVSMPIPVVPEGGSSAYAQLKADQQHGAVAQNVNASMSQPLEADSLSSSYSSLPDPHSNYSTKTAPAPAVQVDSGAQYRSL